LRVCADDTVVFLAAVNAMTRSTERAMSAIFIVVVVAAVGGQDATELETGALSA